MPAIFFSDSSKLLLPGVFSVVLVKTMRILRHDFINNLQRMW